MTPELNVNAFSENKQLTTTHGHTVLTLSELYRRSNEKPNLKTTP